MCTQVKVGNSLGGEYPSDGDTKNLVFCRLLSCLCYSGVNAVEGKNMSAQSEAERPQRWER